MKLLGNIIWLIFGGFITAVEYLAASIALMVTIVGIPFAVQTLKLGMFTLMPFNTSVRDTRSRNGVLAVIMNIIWVLIGGIWIFLTHILFGVLLAITIVGLPFARQHFKLAVIALTPFGRELVYH
ncbi:MAG: YccF domain-containing protein [Candidatus Marinimicrobia bacterium]|nr:YccF domain-containing protein [Candidatus Neomarinimicrobiota bacterium]